jgi:hypothetical protein
VLPPSRLWACLAILALPVWVGSSLIPVHFAGIQIVNGSAPPEVYGSIIVFAGVGTAAFLRLVWLAFRRERVAMDGLELSIRRELAGLGRTKRFASGEVRNLRYSPGFTTSTRFAPAAAIAFEYGARTYRFGLGIDQAEADDLIRVLKPRISP